MNGGCCKCGGVLLGGRQTGGVLLGGAIQETKYETLDALLDTGNEFNPFKRYKKDDDVREALLYEIKVFHDSLKYSTDRKQIKRVYDNIKNGRNYILREVNYDDGSTSNKWYLTAKSKADRTKTIYPTKKLIENSKCDYDELLQNYRTERQRKQFANLCNKRAIITKQLNQGEFIDGYEADQRYLDAIIDAAANAPNTKEARIKRLNEVRKPRKPKEIKPKKQRGQKA